MIYLLGGSGYIGEAFQSLLRSRGLVFKSIARAWFDYSDPKALVSALKADRVTFVINAAGYTGKPNVDACELHKAECLFGNAVLPGRIAEACAEAGVPWGHVSSGCIFTGSRADGTGFTEEDAPNFTFRQDNCSFYSGTKALGEEVLVGSPHVYIWRLRIPFDNEDSPRNYLTKLIRYQRLLQATNSISHRHEFVAACLDTWLMRVPFGIYNVTNPGDVTTRDVVELIRESGVCRKEFQFFDDEDDFMRQAAKTPRSNCTMTSDKLAAAGIHMTPVREALRNALENWRVQA